MDVWEYFLRNLQQLQKHHDHTYRFFLEEKAKRYSVEEQRYLGDYMFALYHYELYRYWSEARHSLSQWANHAPTYANQHLVFAQQYAREAVRGLKSSHELGLQAFCEMYQHALLIVLLQGTRKWCWGPGALIQDLLAVTGLPYEKAYAVVNSQRREECNQLTQNYSQSSKHCEIDLRLRRSLKYRNVARKLYRKSFKRVIRA